MRSHLLRGLNAQQAQTVAEYGAGIVGEFEPRRLDVRRLTLDPAGRIEAVKISGEVL